MHDNFRTTPEEQGQAATNAPVPESERPRESSEQPPAQSGHAPFAAQPWQPGEQNVSRATWPLVAHDETDVPVMAEAEALLNDELDLKISDLPPVSQSHYLLLKIARLRARLGGKQRGTGAASKSGAASVRRRRISRLLTASAILLSALVLLFGNVPVLRGYFPGLLAPTPTPTSQTTYFSQVVINNGAISIHRSASSSASADGLGPMPQRCPRVSTLLYFTTPLDPPGLGAGPIWLSGFTGPTAALDNLAPFVGDQRAGWYETLAVFIQKGFTGTIILTGADQQSKAPIFLSRMDSRVLVPSLSLNLNNGDRYIADGAWEMASVTLVIPTAGCYRLHASWGDSSWDRYFAAGA